MALPEIGLKAILDDANFQAGLKRYTDGVGKMESATERGAGILSRLGSVASGAVVVGLGAATAAAGAFVAAAKVGVDAAMEWGETLDKLGDMFGMSGDQASQYASLFSHFGVPVEEAAMQLNFLTRGLAETVKVGKDGKTTLTPFGESLRKLGISATDAKGRVKSLNVIFPELVKAFSKLPPSIQKSNLAMELFGARGGSKMLDLLSAGSEAFEEARKRAHAFGLDLSTDEVTAIEDFGFALNDTKDGIRGFWTQIGVHLLPIIRQMVDYLNKNVIPAFVQWARDVMPRVASALKLAADAIGLIAKGFQSGNWQPFVQFIDKLFGRETANNIANFILWMQGVRGEIDKLAKVFQTKGLGEAAKIWSADIWKWLTDKGGAIDQVGVQLGKLKVAIADWLNKNGPATWGLVTVWVNEFWNWITDSKSGVLVTVADKMALLAKAIEEWAKSKDTIKQMQDVGANLANDILDGMGQIFEQQPGAENLLYRLGRTLWNAAQSLASFFSNIGASIASGVVRGIAGRFVDAGTAQQIANAVQSTLNNVLNILIGPGGPLAQIGIRIAQSIFDAFIAAWNLLFGSWNPLAGLNSAGGGGEGGGNIGALSPQRNQIAMPGPAMSGANNSRTLNFYHTWNGNSSQFERSQIEAVVRDITHVTVADILGTA